MASDEKTRVNTAAVRTARPKDDDEMEINLGELFAHFGSKWYVWMSGLIIGALLAILVTTRITPKFTATAKLYMVSASSSSIVDLSDFSIGNSLSSDYEQLLKVRDVLDQVIDKLNLSYTYEELSSMISISTVSDTRIVQISVESTDAVEAASIANTLVSVAVDQMPNMTGTNPPRRVETAIPPEAKSSPSFKKNTVIGAMAGLLICLAALTISFISNDTLTTADDVKNKLGALPLTVIPEGNTEKKREFSGDSRRGGRKASSGERKEKRA